jgi:hypothetical protein
MSESEEDGFPPIRNIVELVNTIIRGECATIETTNGVRVVLPAPPEGASETDLVTLSHLGQEMERVVVQYEYVLSRIPSPADARGPHEPPVSPD